MIIHQYIPFLFKPLTSIGCKMVIFYLLYLLVDMTVLFSEGSSWFLCKYDQIKDFFKVIFKSILKMLSCFSSNFAFSFTC